MARGQGFPKTCCAQTGMASSNKFSEQRNELLGAAAHAKCPICGSTERERA
jgi:hypothetical protein